MAVRPFAKEDIQPLKEILEATGAFRPEEIGVGIELMEIVAAEPGQEDYLMYTGVDEQGQVQGYYCVGPTPMTERTYDLYWIAVNPSAQGRGMSGELLQHCIRLVANRGGSKIIAETSSQQLYDRTRAFYRKHGFKEEARIADYYSAGDDLVVYTLSVNSKS
ncbi:MAG: GNAT family N-acetyltransferase [Ignavibacteriales bacterium]|nr:GNAT family N-acetyltransferase [Ignavibacteriales bacterium]